MSDLINEFEEITRWPKKRLDKEYIVKYLSEKFKSFAAKRDKKKKAKESLSERQRWHYQNRVNIEGRKHGRRSIRARGLSPRSSQGGSN